MMEFNNMYNFSNPELDDLEGVAESIEMSPSISTTGDRYVLSPSLQSVKSEGWQHNQNNLLFNQQQQWQWPSMEHESQSNTPMNPMHFQEGQQNQTYFNHPQYTPAQTIIESIPGSPVNGSTPTETREQAHNRRQSTQHGASSSSQATLARRDGMRKKNVRIEIPAERTLNNIDLLISKSTDEAEIRELKSQKRLLRNRQAALDSRQRKKQHTERLEDEKKRHQSELEARDEEIGYLNIRVRDLEVLINRLQQEHQVEKELIITEKTRSEGDLRKKNNILAQDNAALLEQVNLLMSQPGRPNDHQYPRMSELSMDDRDDMFPSFINDFPSEPETDAVVKADPEKSVGQGILMMLLLFGAFCASKAGTTATIPPMNDDIRTASVTILEDLFTEAGVATTTNSFDPSASAHVNSWNGMATTHVNMAQITRDGFQQSSLGNLHHQLSQPSQEQERDQLFGMSAQEFNDVTSYDFLDDAPVVTSTSVGRRSLADSLAAMRGGNGKKADVYTRSLLWDQVPQDVVRRFAQMVEGHGDPNILG